MISRAAMFWFSAVVAQVVVPSASQYGPPADTLTMEMWRSATVEYKLLAAGEWVHAVLGDSWLLRNGHAELGRKAAELLICLEDTSVGIGADDAERTADLAVVCMALMGWKPPP